MDIQEAETEVKIPQRALESFPKTAQAATSLPAQEGASCGYIDKGGRTERSFESSGSKESGSESTKTKQPAENACKRQVSSGSHMHALMPFAGIIVYLVTPPKARQASLCRFGVVFCINEAIKSREKQYVCDMQSCLTKST